MGEMTSEVARKEEMERSRCRREGDGDWQSWRVTIKL